jgi:cyanophycin synthetase
MQKCVDCGDAPVNHRLAWISSVVEHVLTPHRSSSKRLLGTVDRLTAPLFYEVCMPLVMKTLVALHLSGFRKMPDERTSGRARVMWEEALRRGIAILEFRLFGIGREAFLVSYEGRSRTFLDLPRPGVVSSPGLLWMDDKEILRERLAEAGVPVARGGVATSVHKARELFTQLRPPVVVKPEIGSRSRHTTTHIQSAQDLETAFHKARVLSPWVIIEEEDTGFVYRATVVGGKLVAVLRREPPLVIADGVHTVAQLIEEENKNPRRDGKIFHKIKVDEEGYAELARQGLTLDSIPEKGRAVTFSQKATRGIGGGTTDVTDNTHEDNRVMLEDAVKVVDDPLVGIDFIISDVTKSWKEQERTGIIEFNSMPFIDLHHYPLVGEPRNVAGALWDIVLPTWSEK